VITGLLKWSGLILSLALLPSCMVGPNYVEPKTNIAPHWLTDKTTISEKHARNTIWWQVFHDPNLTALIEAGYRNNYSLQIAGVRILQTRAQLAQSVGSLYPQQQVSIGNVNYNRIGGSSLQSILPTDFYTALLGLSANWEIDFWGKYRRAIQMNDANFLASFAAYDNALVALTADIASVYINIRVLEKLTKITKDNIAIQSMSLKIAKSRYNSGQTSLLDVEQAQTEVSETESTLPTLISDLQHQKDLLAVLLGTTPNNIDRLITKNLNVPTAPMTIAIGIPKETLAKRPDIHQARLQAIAQSAAIGAAKANLYPALSLTGTFALASNTINNNSLSSLFNLSSSTITAGPGFSWPLLNYGQITNAVRVQDAAFQQALLNYMNLTLKAEQEVQDNIISTINTQKSKQFLTTASHAAVKSTQLAIIRYKEGEADYTTVLDAERQQLSVQTALTKATGAVPLAVVALYRSLGGGWQIRCNNDIVRQDIKQSMYSRTNWGNLLIPENHFPATNKGQVIKELYLPNW